MELKILLPEEIKQPKANLVHEEPLETDWVKDDPVLGGAVEHVILCPEKDWTPFITEFELQRNNWFDAFNCVTQSAWNKIQCLAKKQYGVQLNKSKRYTALKSGTKPGVGNSVTNVVESIRKQGGVEEEVCPSMSPTMTQEQFYSPLPASMDALESFLGQWEYNHEWLPKGFQGATLASILEDGLQYSPVMVSIEGSYTFDDQGRLMFTNKGYAHEVLCVASKPDCFLVLDSENPQGLMKVRKDYAFVGLKIGFIKKKTQNSMKYRIQGNNAVFQLDPISKNLVPYGSGKVYKVLQGTVGYEDITVVENLAELEKIAPLADWIITESPWDKSSFINSLQ